MKIQNKCLYGLLFLMLMSVLVGCFNGKIYSGREESVLLYFFSHLENTLVAEEVPIKVTPPVSEEQLMVEVINALYKGPANSSIQGVQPLKATIKEAPELKEQTAYINFDKGYSELTVEEQITARASIVFSLTELDFIQGVEFFVDDQPLTNFSGEKVGTVKRVDILISPLNSSPPTNKQVIKLYFANPADHKLYAEQREIEVNSNKPIERYIMEELIRGPETPGLVATLPSDTKINGDIKTQDGVCQVDLSYDLKSVQVATPLSEKLMIYSVVNSLTEIRKVQKVGFLMDGKKPTDVSTTIDFSQLFERDESIIGLVE